MNNIPEFTTLFPQAFLVDLNKKEKVCVKLCYHLLFEAGQTLDLIEKDNYFSFLAKSIHIADKSGIARQRFYLGCIVAYKDSKLCLKNLQQIINLINNETRSSPLIRFRAQ